MEVIQIPAREWFILGAMVGITGTVALIGLYRIYHRLLDIRYERKRKRREMKETIDQLEDHANK